MVFLNYYDFECFCWVNFDLFSCIDEMIYLVLYFFLWFILIVLLFLSAFGNAECVSSVKSYNIF